MSERSPEEIKALMERAKIAADKFLKGEIKGKKGMKIAKARDLGLKNRDIPKGGK